MVPTASLNYPTPVAILTGPTASGKTGLAIQLAKNSPTPIEIINADSVLVYRGLDIGSAKPPHEERAGIPHHLIDICSPDHSFTAGQFYRAALRAIDEIHSRGSRALIVGGTGFYLKTLLFGLWEAPEADPALREALSGLENTELSSRLEKVDPASALRIGPNDRYRLIRALELVNLTGKTPTELQAQQPTKPDPRFQLWVLDRDSQELNTRISLRTRQMIESGLIEETRKLASLFPGARSLNSVGYAQVLAFLAGRSPEGRKLRPGIAGLTDEIELATRQLVKSQRTWFRGQKMSQWFFMDRDRLLLEEKFQQTYS